MALNRGGAAVYATGRDVYGMPEAAGARSGDRRGGQAGGRRAARCVHDAAGQPGEGEPGAAMRVSEKRREPCRAPKVRGQKYCCMHLAMEAARPTKFSLPALDDANSIQVALNKTAQGLVDGTLDEKVATKLAYVLQVAMSNVGKVNFEPEEERGRDRGGSGAGKRGRKWKKKAAEGEMEGESAN